LNHGTGGNKDSTLYSIPNRFNSIPDILAVISQVHQDIGINGD